MKVLKALPKNKDGLYQSYSIIMHELERFTIQKELDEINELINNNYKKNKSYFQLLLSIMEFFDKTKKIVIFILDQLKMENIEDGFLEKIK